MTSYLHFSGAPVPFNLFRLDVPCLSHHRICLKQLRTEEIIREFHKPLSSVLHMGLSDNVCVCVRLVWGDLYSTDPLFSESSDADERYHCDALPRKKQDWAEPLALEAQRNGRPLRQPQAKQRAW